MNLHTGRRPGIGQWHRHGKTITLDDPFTGCPCETENGGAGGTPPRRAGMPSPEQLDLLRSFLGSDAAGARHRLANFWVPPGLTEATLRWYADIARRALADPAKATPKAQVVQALRLQLVALALGMAPGPQGELESFTPDFIRWLQLSLNDVLESKLNVDATLGTATRTAIRTFQRLAGLDVDGDPGPLTEAALRAAAVAPCSNARQPCEILDKFAFDRARVPAEHRPKILRIARCVLASHATARPIRELQVVGHTDDQGSDDYNKQLGLDRALEVAGLLTDTLDTIRPGSAAGINIVSDTRGEFELISAVPEKNRRVVVCLPHCTCNGFFREYDLISSPSLRFGVPSNERLDPGDKETRRIQVETMVGVLLDRRNRRAQDALVGKVPVPAPLTGAVLLGIADSLSDLQLTLFRECFPGGAPVIDFAHFADCFERFANGELRDPAAGQGIEGVGEPEGGFFFLFAEFAFLCVDTGLNDWLWKDILRVFVMTQEIFMHVYRVDQRAPAPPVGAPLPAQGPATRALGTGFGFRSFNPAAQSDDARKAALRAKYAPMGTDALRAAARDNLLRAQRMP